jgi:hypothetical protein
MPVQPFQHRPVTAVQAIEISDGDSAALVHRAQVMESTYQSHQGPFDEIAEL